MAEKAYGKDKILAIYGDRIAQARTIVQGMKERRVVGSWDMIRGHVTTAILDILPYLKAITFLRNPVDRVTSLYAYIRRDPKHPIHQAVMGMELEEFATSGISLETNDGMVRQLCGTEPELPQTIYTAEVYPNHTPFGEMTRDHLVGAMAKLVDFTLVGTVERLPETVKLLKIRFQEFAPIQFPHVNKSNKPHITQAARKAIGELNGLDYHLWRWATDELGEDTQWI